MWAATIPNRNNDSDTKKVVEINEHECCGQIAGTVAMTWQAGQFYYVNALMMSTSSFDSDEDYLQVGIVFNGTVQQMPVTLAHDVVGGPHCPVTPSNPDANGGVCGPGAPRSCLDSA